MWRIIVAIGLVFGMSVVVTPPAALACSCVAMSPAEQLRGANAAFVGTLISVGAGDESYGGEEIDWTFQVEQVVKGELGSTVDVRSPVDTGACGFQMAEGMRVGIFLHKADGRWHGSMCGQVGADALLATTQPTPAPDASGLVALLVGNRGEDPRIIALDGEGRTLGFGAGDGEVRSISVCPTSERFTELVAYQDRETRYIAVRETRTLQVVEEYTLSDASMNVMALHCRNESGSDIIIHETIQTPEMVNTNLIHHLQDGTLQTLYSSEPLAEGGSVATFDFEGGVAYLTAGYRGNHIIRVDLLTGDVTSVLTVPAVAGEADYLTSLALSPDKTRLAALGIQSGQTSYHRVLVMDLTTEPVSVVELSLGSSLWFSSVLWLSNDTFAITIGEAARSGAPVYNDALEQVGAIWDWGSRQAVRVDDTLYGLGWYGELIAAPLPDGPATTIRTFDNPNIFVMAAVQDEIEIDPPAEPSPVATPEPTSTTAEAYPVSSPGARNWGSARLATPTEDADAPLTDDFNFGTDDVLEAQSRSPDSRGWFLAAGILSIIVAGGWGLFRWLER